MKRNYDSTSALLTLASIVTAVAALYFARDILLPVALAILLSFLLTPLANRLERWGLGRILSVLAVVGITFSLLGGLGWVVTSQVADFSAKLPEYREAMGEKFRTVAATTRQFVRAAERSLEEVQGDVAGKGDAKDADAATADSADDQSTRKDAEVPPRNDRDDAFEFLTDRNNGAVEVKVISMPPSPLTQVRTWLGPLVAPLTTAGIVVVLVIFLLIQREDQRNRLLHLFGDANLHATTEALADVSDRVSRYLRMQFLINACYGLSVGLGTYFLGVPNAVMWGVLSFSLRFLPYLGPWLSAVMPVAVSLAISDGWTQPALVAGWFVVLELIVNNVAEPYFYGHSVGVSGVGVIFAAIFWSWLWGPIGLILAMPLTVCLVVFAQYAPQLRFIRVLFGDQPTLGLPERIYQRLLAEDDREIEKLVRKKLEESTLPEVFDEVLIPALRMAERDRRAGVLSEDQEEFVADAIGRLVTDLGEQARAARAVRKEASPQGEGLPTVEKGSEQPTDRPVTDTAKILCVPLGEEADELVGSMLRELVGDEVAFDLVAPETLTGEIVDLVAAQRFDLVVVSTLAPRAMRDSRLLRRRLRDSDAALPILLGLWSHAMPPDAGRRLAAEGPTEAVATLRDAATRIAAIATRVRAANPHATPPSTGADLRRGA